MAEREPETPRFYFDMSVAGMRAWSDLAAGFGDPAWYHPTGNLELAGDDDSKRELYERIQRLRDWGYRARVLTPAETADLEPDLHMPPNTHVAFFPDEGHVDGDSAVTAIVDRAMAAGVTVMHGAEVNGLTMASGRVTGVHLASGDTIPGDIVALCAGWRSTDLAASIDVHLQLIPAGDNRSAAPCLVGHTSTIERLPLQRIIQVPDHLGVRPAGDRVRLEAGDINQLTDLATTDEQAAAHGDTLLQRARDLFPHLATARVDSTKICVRPLPVDGYPIIGWTPAVDDLYIIVTHSGVTLAPLLAQLATTEIMNAGTTDELQPYRLSRFETA